MVNLEGKIILNKGCLAIVFDTNTILSNFSNFLSGVPEKHLACKTSRDGMNYHLTVISAGETIFNQSVKSFFTSVLNSNHESNSESNYESKLSILNELIKIKVIGLGTNSDCYYLVCLSPQLDMIRKSLGLNSKDFHITLGFNGTDKHDISKGIDTIKGFVSDPIENIIENVISNLSDDFDKNINILTKLNIVYPENFLILKNLINQLAKKSNYSKAIEYSLGLIEIFPEFAQSYYIYLCLCVKTDSIDLEVIKNIYTKLLLIENIKQEKIGWDICKMINWLNFKYYMIQTDDLVVGEEKLDLLDLPEELVETDNKNNKWFEILSYDIENKKIIQVRFNGFYDKINLDLFGKSIGEKYSLLDSNKSSNTNYLDDFVFDLNTHIITTHSNPNKTIKIYIKDNETNTNNSLNILNYKQTELPSNFSKIDCNLYGSGIVSARHIRILSKLKINTIINLIGEEKPKEDLLEISKQLGIKVHHMGFPDRTACQFDLYLRIQEIILNPQSITLVHCVGGIGRTNMILSGYLMKTYCTENPIAPSEAICLLKKSRKVIMVPEQVMFLKKYYGYLSNGSENVKNIPIPPSLRGLVLLVGLPCSGKSTLALEIYSKYSSMQNNIIHINQDEIGKSACEQLLSSQAKSADMIILDRCNPTSTDRVYWINMYRGLCLNKVTVIYLNLGLDLSLARLPERKNHLTLGETGGKIIMDMCKKLSQPTKLEGWDELVEIKTEKELEDYKRKIGLDVINNGVQVDINLEPIDLKKIIKFPRTKHIMNLGAMTRDDLLMDKLDIESMLKGEITVEEKIDGANMGFSLVDGKIRAQNRSHYVCSESHAQFKKLDQWIETNKFDLLNILSRGNLIIYGEWLYSKHSIAYTKLPDYFIMFDLYDTDTKTFYSRDYLESILLGTQIKLVPLIYKGKATLDKLKSLVQTKSAFYDGIIEGVYVRSFDTKTNKLKYRAKIVRADFISGDEHWTKGKQTTNIVIKF